MIFDSYIHISNRPKYNVELPPLLIFIYNSILRTQYLSSIIIIAIKKTNF